MTTTMPHRLLGDTGLEVSRIGLGLAALGRPGYINLGHADDLDADYDVDHMRSRAHAVLDVAWDAGVRYFDAARSYGRAEEFLGTWIRTRGMDDRAVVGSKWGYTYTADWQVKADQHEVKEHTRDNFTRQWALSRAELREHLAVYQAHSVTFSSGALEDDALLDALTELKGAGVAIGLSLSGPDQAAVLQDALAITRDGERLFETVQATWNVLEQSAGAALAAAHGAGMGVIVKEALANGRLTDRGDATSPALSDAAKAHAVGVDAVALAAVLANDWADVVLSGAATIAHLRSNLASAQVELSTDELAQIKDMAEEPDQYWKRRDELEWS